MGSVAPQGLWAVSATEPERLDAPFDRDVTCDVLVVGAGFCGLSAALHLAEAGREVILVDTHGVGWGASGRNGGQVIAGLKLDLDECIAAFGPEGGRALHDFGKATADLVFDLIERFQIRCEAHRNGWIQVARTPKIMATLDGRIGQLQADGQDIERVDAKRLSDLIGSDFYIGGLLDRRSGSVQPLAYARGLARAARAAGAAIYGKTPVTALDRAGTGWQARTPCGTVTAKHVLLATNGYIGDLHEAVKQAIIPVQSYQVATDPLPEPLSLTIIPSGMPVSDMPYLNVYFRRDDAGRFILGGRGGVTETEIPDLFDEAIGHARRIFPGLCDIPFTERWRGTMAMTRDHLPRLVALEDGLLSAYGCNGRGVALATSMGRLAARRLLGDAHGTLPIANLPPVRYPFHDLAVWVAGLATAIRPLRALLLARS